MRERRGGPGAPRAGAVRLFVALELPDEVRAALGRLQEELRPAGAGRLRWVRPEGIHVTLKFLGEVEEKLVGQIEEALAGAVTPFELRLQPGSLGGFGGARLRVVWVGLEGDTDELRKLAGQIEEALAPLGFPKERRPFAAHLTIGRVRDEASSEERRQIDGLLRRHRCALLPSMILTEVTLMRSILGPGGSTYVRLATFPKKPSARPLTGQDSQA